MPLYTRRLSIDITDEQAAKIANLIPWGLKARLMTCLIDELLELIEKHGEIVIGAILSKNLKALELISTAQEAKSGKS